MQTKKKHVCLLFRQLLFSELLFFSLTVSLCYCLFVFISSLCLLFHPFYLPLSPSLADIGDDGLVAVVTPSFSSVGRGLIARRRTRKRRQHTNITVSPCRQSLHKSVRKQQWDQTTPALRNPSIHPSFPPPIHPSLSPSLPPSAASANSVWMSDSSEKLLSWRRGFCLRSIPQASRTQKEPLCLRECEKRRKQWYVDSKTQRRRRKWRRKRSIVQHWPLLILLCLHF